MSRRPISRFSAKARSQTLVRIELSTLAVFRVTGCKPANPERTQVRTFCAPTILPTAALTWHSACWPTRQVRTANPANLVFWSDGGEMLRSRPRIGY